jgi:O-antigen/teichoic acid export membrane protein
MTEKKDDQQTTVDSISTVLSGGALVSVGKVLALAAGFLTQVTMARLLTEATYGEVVLALSIVNIVGLVGKMGLDDGIMRQFPHHEDVPAKARGVARAGLSLAAVAGISVGVVVFLAAPLIANSVFNNSSLIPLIRLGAFGIPLAAVNQVSVSLARGARDARPQAYVKQVIQPSSRFLLTAVFLLAGLEAIGAVGARVGSILIGTVLVLVMAKRILPSYDVKPESMYRPVLAFSIPLIAVQGLGFLNTNVDIYMVGYFLASSELGIYNIGLQLSNMVTAVLSTAGFLLPPMMTRLHDQGRTAETRRVFQLITKWMVVLILPIVTVLFFAPRLVIGTMFGDSYNAGATALRILLVGKIFGILMGLNAQGLIALGKNRTVSYLIFFQTVVNVTLNVSLIPIIGIEGAAIGMAVSGILGDILGVAILNREFSVHPFSISVLTPLAAIGGVALASAALLSVLGLPLSGTVIVVGLAYLPIVLTLVPEEEDRELLNRLEDRIGIDLSLVDRLMFERF